jgi:50S ribosomal subunit-associated GTPase HflX
LGAGEIPVIVLMNKIDKLTDPEQINSLLALFPDSLAVSVKKGIGLDEVRKLLVRSC